MGLRLPFSAGEGLAPPLRDERGNVPQEGRGESGARPYGVFTPPFGSEGQARFHGCGGHRIAQDRNCPVGAALCGRPPFVGHDVCMARRPGAPPLPEDAGLWEG